MPLAHEIVDPEGLGCDWCGPLDQRAPSPLANTASQQLTGPTALVGQLKDGAAILSVPHLC